MITKNQNLYGWQSIVHNYNETPNDIKKIEIKEIYISHDPQEIAKSFNKYFINVGKTFTSNSCIFTNLIGEDFRNKLFFSFNNRHWGNDNFKKENSPSRWLYKIETKTVKNIWVFKPFIE